MGMNRQMKRMMQRQGQLAEDGSPAVQTRERRGPRPPAPPRSKSDVGLFRRMFNFVREVRAELRKVAWPTRNEVANLSVVVLATLVILISLIFVLDLAFAKAVLYLFKT
ncbi:MAG TPA: preprotein translocase subunit SecE [Acidimicrobiales bacterium]|nr:preprotein translocase subunit SecE [Acidimicrobiales bacterium]